MARMPNAPLRYTLMVARFPKILNIGHHVAAFQEAVRGEYPLLDHTVGQGMTATGGPEGVRFEVVADQLWQFAEADRSHALILGPEFLVLHAGIAYTSSADFISRFQYALRALKSVRDLNIQHVNGLGYRYVDLIAPRPEHEERLGQYLASWILPTETPDLGGEGLQFVENANMTAFRTPSGILRVQALRNPPTTMPPDLDSPLVQKNGWVPPRPTTDFAILDIDHVGTFEPRPLDAEAIGEAFFALRASARLIFDRVTTPFAVNVWEGRT